LDVQAAEEPHVALAVPASPTPPAPDPEEVRQVADQLVGARAPVVLAGRGAVLSEAGPALESLGQRIGALMTTSANGHGLFAGNPWSLGISGGFASPTAAGLLRRADLVVAFGASLNMWTTRHDELIGPDARVVQVDIDADALGAHRPVDIGLVADARVAAEALTADLERRGHAGVGRRGEEVARTIAAGGWGNVAHEDASVRDRIDPRTFSKALETMLPAQR